MKIRNYLQAVQTHLEGVSKADLVGVDMRGFNVAISASRFDPWELQHESFRAPAIRLSFIGGPRSKALANEERSFDLAFAAFVITDRRDRIPAGMDLVEWAATALVLFRPASMRGVGPARDQRIEALSSADFEKRSVDLHAVAWTATCRLGRDEIDAGVHDPSLLVADPEGIEVDIVSADLPEGI